MNKVITIVSSILLSISMCLLISTHMKHPNVLYYMILLLVFLIGAVGLRYTHDPEAFKASSYAIAHAIVINFQITFSRQLRMVKIRRSYSFIDRFYILYGEGLDLWKGNVY